MPLDRGKLDLDVEKLKYVRSTGYSTVNRRCHDQLKLNALRDLESTIGSPAMSPTSSSSAANTRLRSLYRSLLRELPQSHSASHSSKPSAFLSHLRKNFSHQPNYSAANNSAEQAEQFLTYFRAQRMYATLLERYNPGIAEMSGMGGEDAQKERVRLTARRVGMRMPKGWYGDTGGETKE